MRKLSLAAGLCVVAFVVAPIASASAEPTFVGACVITGTATFGEGGAFTGAKLPVTGTAPLNYQFKSGPILPVKVDATVCSHLSQTQAVALAKDLADEPADGSPPDDSVADVTEAVSEGEVEEIKAEAEVKGKGLLGCEKAAGGWGKRLEPAFGETFGPGTGKLKVGATSAKFKFRFISTGTQVHFQAGEEAAADEDKNYTAAGEASFAGDAAGVAACKPGSLAGPKELEFTAVTAGVI